MRSNATRVRLAAALALVLAVPAPAVQAQDGAPVTGVVTDVQNLALPGAAVVLRTGDGGFVASSTTDRTGRFALPGVAAGHYVLSAALLGFETHTEPIAVTTSGASTSITLQVGAFMQEVTVSALMPEVTTELAIAAGAIERRVARDLAQSLRDQAGVTALRRGAINLDPSVRGLYAEQIGIFVDGTRTFAAGPARMDSGLSHVSPHALQSLRIVRGPYALTWGAGTLSAIRADTFKPAFSGGDFEIGGRAGYNYGSNGDANDAVASLHGSSDRIRFTFQHNTRIGSDYLDGDRETVQGDYEVVRYTLEPGRPTERAHAARVHGRLPEAERHRLPGAHPRRHPVRDAIPRARLLARAVHRPGQRDRGADLRERQEPRDEQ